MHASSEAQVALAADVRVGCGVVRMWFRGEYHECEHTSKHSVNDYRRAESYDRFVA
jgi:hypothetical protein